MGRRLPGAADGQEPAPQRAASPTQPPPLLTSRLLAAPLLIWVSPLNFSRKLPDPSQARPLSGSPRHLLVLHGFVLDPGPGRPMNLGTPQVAHHHATNTFPVTRILGRQPAALASGRSRCSRLRLRSAHPTTPRAIPVGRELLSLAVGKRPSQCGGPQACNLAGQQPGPWKTLGRRTSRTCQTMELDEGPPDHARSTYGRRNVAGERCVTPMSERTLPTTRTHPGWGRGREPGSEGRASQLGTMQRSHPNTLPSHPERSTDSSQARL